MGAVNVLVKESGAARQRAIKTRERTESSASLKIPESNGKNKAKAAEVDRGRIRGDAQTKKGMQKAQVNMKASFV